MFDTLGNPVIMFSLLDLSTKKPVEVDCTDLRLNLESFEFDEDLVKVGELVFTFNNPNGIFDDDERLSGEDKLIRFRWGYLTHLSPEKTAIIRYSQPSYPSNGVIKLKVHAWDASASAYMRAHPRNWGMISSSEIARAVAVRWGLNPVIPEDSNDARKKAYIQPANTADLSYVKQLAKNRGWECWTDGVNLYYGPDSYDDRPALVAVYRNAVFSSQPNVAPIVLTDFSPEIDHGKRPDTRRVSVDPYGKAAAHHKSDDKDAATGAERKSLGKNLVRTVNGVEYKSIPSNEMENGAGKTEATAEASPEQVKKDAQAQHWRILRKAIKAKASFVGNPDIRVRRIVEILGVSETHSGNWKIVQAKHKISAKGTSYEVSTTLHRSAKNKGKTSSENKNLKEGEEQKDTVTPKTTVLHRDTRGANWLTR